MLNRTRAAVQDFGEFFSRDEFHSMPRKYEKGTTRKSAGARAISWLATPRSGDNRKDPLAPHSSGKTPSSVTAFVLQIAIEFGMTGR